MSDQEQLVISSNKVTLPIPPSNYYALLEGRGRMNAKTKEVSPWYWEFLTKVSLIFVLLTLY